MIDASPPSRLFHSLYKDLISRPLVTWKTSGSRDQNAFQLFSDHGEGQVPRVALRTSFRVHNRPRIRPAGLPNVTRSHERRKESVVLSGFVRFVDFILCGVGLHDCEECLAL